MKQYNIRYDKTINILLALIFPPLLGIPALIIAAVYFPGLPEWALVSIIVTSFSLAIGLSFYVIKRVSPYGILTLNDDGFVVDFPQKTFFTPGSFEIKISDIIQVSMKGNKVGYYMRFSTNTNQAEFNISQGSKSEEDGAAFQELMVTLYRMIGDETKIK
jgi:hypothetical protein